MSQFILYNYFRSSASYRVRLALELKQLRYEYRPVHLLQRGGEQNDETFRALNPMGEVPCLIHVSSAAASVPFTVSQSMAILLYLDAVAPLPGRLFPADPRPMAAVVQVCEMINSGIHPLQNLRVLQFLSAEFGASDAQRAGWSCHWIERGFRALEALLKGTAGTCCFQDEISAADCFLIPQIYNARKFSVDLKPFPTLSRIEAHLCALPFARAAHPEEQPDFPVPTP